MSLYFGRDESAITETSAKYGGYCTRIAMNILRNSQDAEECVNETYLRAWNAIPPARPERLSTFLGKICRNLALNLHEKLTAEKRGGGRVEIALEELSDCFSDGNTPLDTLLRAEKDRLIVRVLNDFLERSKKRDRMVFVGRYWRLDCVEDIARDLGLSSSNVKQICFRMRASLKLVLEKEGLL
jgi:RNA polymerase sigma-70 factor (ECF subfamily)